MTVGRRSIVASANILWSLTAPRAMTSALVIPISRTIATSPPSSCPITTLTLPSSKSPRQCGINDRRPSSQLFSTTSSPESSPSSETTKTLKDIHDFWFPVPEGHSNDDSRAFMNDANYIGAQMNDWFFGGDVMDEKSRAFQSLIRSEKAKHSASALAQDTHKDLMAKVVMFDQIVRNAFRKQDEAFAYEEEVIDILEYLFDVKDDADQAEITDEALSAFVNKDEVTFCDVYFVGVALSHQEKPIFHGVDIRMHTKFTAKRWPENQSIVDQLVEFSKDHYEVLKRFGRYPHRNEQKGREATAEETEWLNDYDNLPGWAKSQLPKKE